MVAVTFVRSLRQGATVGFAGGTTAGLVYGTLTVPPSIAASGVVGAIAGLTAGVVWILVSGFGRAAPTP